MKNLKAMILGTAVLTASMLSSAAISTWNGSVDGNWDTAGNWDNGVPTSTDQAIISNGDTVTKTGDLNILNNVGTDDDGLQLTNGTLNVSGSLTSTTGYGTNSNPVSNIGVSDGSTTGSLVIGETFNLGNKSDSFSRTFTYNIFTGSSLSADAFQGKAKSYSASTTGAGGWYLNVSGGSASFNSFDFTDVTNLSRSITGQITIGTTGTATGGTVNMGEVSTDWDDFSNQYVLFNDNLGSLTFGKTNYANITDVQTLIDNDYIRKDAGITNGFNIADNGSSWTVTVIPEPSTFAMMFVAGMGMLVACRRRR
ncbi:PEP-CTERM sorting domain-containing protein [Kiritimatiellota bacterium B12222]|nr:PEP-CTERM sorting domain-containing protein [Kiritimatiellota bacterium B12222]